MKTEQKQSLSNFIHCRDVFVVLPTGYGKSLCYGCLPLVFGELLVETKCTVVTPLVAAMKRYEAL